VDEVVTLKKEVDSLIPVFSKVKEDYNQVKTMVEENERKVSRILDISNYETQIVHDIPVMSYQEPEALLKEINRQQISHDRILQEIEHDETVLLHIPSIAPTQGRVIRKFGYVIDPFTGEQRFCQGIDILAEVGEKVYATADGIVKFAGWKRYSGNTVEIVHKKGIVTCYSHLSRVNTKKGRRVRRRDVIGYVGKTGKTEGPRLHYEVWKDRKPVDPLIFILERIETI
jgi:murein DD-endopeptidase MepM/ murein hydrolase activator NlpD